MSSKVKPRTQRFFIERILDNGHPTWTLRDALCTSGDKHDFRTVQWSADCDGACDAFMFWRSAINTVNATLLMEYR